MRSCTLLVLPPSWRAHGLRSRRRGIALVVHDPAALLRYGFGLGTADFLLCRTGAASISARSWQLARSGLATINVNSFDPPHPFQREGVPMDYGGESEAERRARRAAGWTPVVAFETGDRTSASIAMAGSGDPCQVNR